MVESFDPHEPFDCPEEYLRMYHDTYEGREFNWSSYAPVTEPPDAVAHLEKCYLATLTMTDRWFGRFIDSLKKNGLYEDTHHGPWAYAWGTRIYRKKFYACL